MRSRSKLFLVRRPWHWHGFRLSPESDLESWPHACRILRQHQRHARRRCHLDIRSNPPGCRTFDRWWLKQIVGIILVWFSINCCVAIAFVATVLLLVVESLAGYETIGKFRRKALQSSSSIFAMHWIIQISGVDNDFSSRRFDSWPNIIIIISNN